MCVCVCVCVEVYVYMCVWKCVYSHLQRLFHCITTLQCGKTCEMLKAEIKTWLTLHEPDILPHSHYIYIYIYIHTHTHICTGAG